MCNSCTLSDLFSRAALLQGSTELLNFPPSLLFHFIYRFIVLVFLVVSILYSTYSVFVLSSCSAHGSLPQSSTKLRLFSLPNVIVFYLFINYIFYHIPLFSVFHFAHIDGFLCFSPLHVLEIFHYLKVFLQSSAVDWTSLSLLASSSTLLLRTNHRPHSSLHKPLTRVKGLFFIFVTLKMWPIGCPETSVINCHYSLDNNTEERSSHQLRGRSLKSLISYDNLPVNSNAMPLKDDI